MSDATKRMCRFEQLRGVCLAASAIVLVAGAAGAEPAPEPDYARPGWYLGATVFYAISDYSLDTRELGVSPPQPAGINPRFDDTAGVDARGGYRFGERFAVEFDYQWQAGFDSTAPAIAPPLEIDTHLLSLNAKLFALTGRWQPYALVGGSLLIVNTEIVSSAFKKPFDIDTGFAPRFGVGLDYYLDENWSVVVEGTYAVPVGDVRDANMGSVGLGIQYRF